MYLSNTLYRYITPRTALVMHRMCSVYQQLNHFYPCSTPDFYPQFSVFYTPISALYPTVSACYAPVSAFLRGPFVASASYPPKYRLMSNFIKFSARYHITTPFLS